MNDATPTVTGLDHCGNSPRMAITAEILTAWAQRDGATLAPWLAADVTHTTATEISTTDGAGDAEGRESVLETFRAPGAVTRLDVHGLLSHGKEAACDATAILADGRTVDVAHHFGFASAGKQAKVRSIRTYLFVRPEVSPRAAPA